MDRITSSIMRLFPDQDSRAPVVAIIVVVALFMMAVSVKLACQCAESCYAFDRGYVQTVDRTTGQVLWVKK